MPKPETEERDPETEQEILAPEAQTIDSATLALLNKSEIDQQIATAKKYPRSITQFQKLATELATMDEDTAAECVYALPRDGKTIEGPSARFAEIVFYAWGNSRAGARIMGEDEEFVTAMGSCFDLQQNNQIGFESKRRITTKDGKRYKADMIGTTANAAASIALRNAILKVIPKPLWKKIYNEVRRTIAGDIKTLDTRRAAAMKQFQLMGAKPEQIFALLDVKGIDDITLDHLVTLRGIFNAIREGETTVARAFAPQDTEDRNLAAKSEKNLDAIKQKYAQPEKSGASQPPTAPTRNGDASTAEAKAGEPAAPSDVQPEGVVPPPAPQAVAEPEGGPGVVTPSVSQEHGVPDLFDKPKRKR